MWIRKDLLKNAGLEVPKTWEEFRKAAKILTKTEYMVVRSHAVRAILWLHYFYIFM